MKFWWVNQNQTFRQETAGGYLWSPKRKSDNSRNPFYEYMRRVEPGDLIFSFSSTRIKAIGIAKSTAYGFPKPIEFVNVGANWSDYGWCVDVHYHHLENQIRPKDLIAQIRTLLPARHSPLQVNGNGNQSVYLTHVPEGLGNELAALIGREAINLVQVSRMVNESTEPKNLIGTYEGIALLEDRQLEELHTAPNLSDTERRAQVLSRRGQGRFRENVSLMEASCRITEVSRPEHLIASHIKPWRYCESGEERLAGANGLFLTPTADHLFDHGYISFDDDGGLLVSPVADTMSLEKMGVTQKKVRPRRFNTDQKHFLDYHRKDVFLQPELG